MLDWYTNGWPPPDLTRHLTSIQKTNTQTYIKPHKLSLHRITVRKVSTTASKHIHHHHVPNNSPPGSLPIRAHPPPSRRAISSLQPREVRPRTTHCPRKLQVHFWKSYRPSTLHGRPRSGHHTFREQRHLRVYSFQIRNLGTYQDVSQYRRAWIRGLHLLLSFRKCYAPTRYGAGYANIDDVLARG